MSLLFFVEVANSNKYEYLCEFWTLNFKTKLNLSDENLKKLNAAKSKYYLDLLHFVAFFHVVSLG